MKKILLFGFVILFLAGLQGVAPFFLPSRFTPIDILIPVSVWSSFYMRPAEGLMVQLFSGLSMDSISGAPFGFHAIIYVVIWAVVIAVKRWVRIETPFGAGVIASLAGITFECVAGLVVACGIDTREALDIFTGLMLLQYVWILLLSPVFWSLFLSQGKYTDPGLS